MKTLELSDEMYDFLMELSKELNTQDHRGTAMPYVFQIETKEQVVAAEGCGTEAWFYDGSQIETAEQIKEAIFDYKGWDIEDENDIKNYELLDEWSREEILKAAGWYKGNYQYEEKYQNAFLTEKACKEHIRLNHYHYHQPVDYLTHCFRNPELETLIKFLCQLTNGELHK